MCNLSRPGLMLYGVSPIPGFQEKLATVMSLKSRVTLVRTLPGGGDPHLDLDVALALMRRTPRVLAWLERRIAGLPPYPALAVFMVPTLLLLPALLPPAVANDERDSSEIRESRDRGELRRERSRGDEDKTRRSRDSERQRDQPVEIEGAVLVVLDQVFQPAAVEVRDLRPVCQARILHRLRFLVHPQRAAGGGVLCAGLRGGKA